jgi:hypothetical protein
LKQIFSAAWPQPKLPNDEGHEEHEEAIMRKRLIPISQSLDFVGANDVTLPWPGPCRSACFQKGVQNEIIKASGWKVQKAGAGWLCLFLVMFPTISSSRRRRGDRVPAERVAAPPEDLPLLHQTALNEVLEVRVVSSCGWRNQRGDKRKMSSYQLLRKGQGPQQPNPARPRVVILK